MQFSWFKKKSSVRLKHRKRRSTPSAKHYSEHKEKAREIVHARLAHWNQFYGHAYKRVAIRNQRSRWGSCSSKQNLNFNYRLVFLPLELVDYVVVHELCHLEHFNHSESFWLTVEKALPDYRVRKEQLHYISKNMQSYMQALEAPIALSTSR